MTGVYPSHNEAVTFTVRPPYRQRAACHAERQTCWRHPYLVLVPWVEEVPYAGSCSLIPSATSTRYTFTTAASTKTGTRYFERRFGSPWIQLLGSNPHLLYEGERSEDFLLFNETFSCLPLVT